MKKKNKKINKRLQKKARKRKKNKVAIKRHSKPRAIKLQKSVGFKFQMFSTAYENFKKKRKREKL